MKPVLLDDNLPAMLLGEGPHWDHKAQQLYWVDILSNTIHRFDPATKEHETALTVSTVGFAAMSDDGRLVAGLQDGIYMVDFNSGGTQMMIRPKYADPLNRFNDGKCDRRGRLWAGTMNHADHHKNSGAFYRYDEGGLFEQETGIFVSNGLGWSPDNQTMYYTDTRRNTIWAYDYDIETGEATNRRDFIVFKGDNGRPDGMCVDSQGRLLVCLWGGARIEIFTAEGEPYGKIDIPAPHITCCCFGGADLKTLYITTASTGLDEASMKKWPDSGKIFVVQMDVPGLAETPFVAG